MNEQVKFLSQVLRENGHRLTTCRRIILEALVESGGHLSADELACSVRDCDANVSRMTIYRTLDLLCDLGHVRPIYQGSGAARYVLLQDGRHHHFVCSRCQRVFELDDCLIDDLSSKVRGAAGFEVHAHLLELFGICDTCQG